MAGREVPLLEREAELDELQAALEDARNGIGRLVVVEGPAGIGKTRLLAAARETAGRTGMRVLAARGTELERDFPFGVVRQLFEPVVHAASEAERAELLAGAARLARAVVGIDLEHGDVGDTDRLDPSFATLNALYWITYDVAERQPVLLLVDDGHWSDQPSLRFLRFLLPRLEELPVLVAVAARTDEPGAPGLLAQLGSDSVTRVLRVGPLSERAVAELVRAELAGGVADDFCLACHAATGGNPFMVRELLGELIAQGSSGASEEAARVRELAPATIQRAVLVRLARVSDEAQRLARAIAVLGDDAEPQQAAALAQLERAVAGEVADELAGAGILESARPLRFSHPLVRNAVYADLPGAERAFAHARAARLLTDEGAESERVAIHLLATDPGDDVRVVETLQNAARGALRRGAPEVGVRYLRRALAERPAAAERANLLGELLRCGVRAADWSIFAGISEDPIAELTREPADLMAFALELAPWLFTAGRMVEAVDVMNRGIAVATEAGEYGLAIRLESRFLAVAGLRPPEATARLERYADRFKPATAEHRLWLAMRAWWRHFPGGSASESAVLAREALSDGQLLEEQPGDTPVVAQTILVLVRADEIEEGAAWIDRALESARRRGSVAGFAGALAMRGYLAFRRGDVASAADDARRAVEIARRRGLALALAPWTAWLVDALLERGELDEARAQLQASGMDGPLPDHYFFMMVRFGRGCLWLEQGRTDQGLGELRAMLELADGTWPDTYPLASTLALALAARGEAELEEARRLAAAELEEARRWGTPRGVGVALRAVGIIDGGEKGIERLREAVQVLARSPARLEHARALADYGAALRRANRRADARQPLREALAIARGAGALAIAKRAHEELEATGEKLRPLIASGVESLTPSERRVAEMAAEGRSNREIAQALFLTVKTVETHLSHAYRKLDISSRSELARALTDVAPPARS